MPFFAPAKAGLLPSALDETDPLQATEKTSAIAAVQSQANAFQADIMITYAECSKNNLRMHAESETSEHIDVAAIATTLSGLSYTIIQGNSLEANEKKWINMTTYLKCSEIKQVELKAYTILWNKIVYYDNLYPAFVFGKNYTANYTAPVTSSITTAAKRDSYGTNAIGRVNESNNEEEPSFEVPNCIDSDSSEYPTIASGIAGTASVLNGPDYEDVCLNSTTLKEYYCNATSNKYALSFSVSCPRCANAKCLCIDGTPENSCSAMLPTFCDSRLKIIQNCHECGCFEGYNCMPNGACARIDRIKMPMIEPVENPITSLFNSISTAISRLFDSVL